MISIQNAENVLKQVYLDVISNQLNTVDGFISMVEKTTEDVFGKEIRVLIDKTEEGEYFLTNQELANIYGYIQLSDKAIRVAETSAGAFVNLLNSEVESMLEYTKEHIINATYGEDVMREYYPKDYENNLLVLSGLKEVFDTEKETLYGIDRKKYNFNPIVKTIKEINTFEIEQIIDENNSEVNFLICNPNTKRKIQEFMSSHYQNIDMKELPDGYNYMEFNKNIVIQTYKYMSDNEIWLVNSNDFKFHQLCDWRWLEDENGKVLKQVLNKPVYRATLVKYCNLICHNVKGQIKIKIGE